MARAHGHSPILSSGNANHAPMALEAMSALGRIDCGGAWLRTYEADFAALPSGSVEGEIWRTGLGQHGRLGDWIAYFEGELTAGDGWSRLAPWCVRLAPGLAGAAGHGLIRTGHATRALARRESATRWRELAHGLAYWAADYTELPGEPLVEGELQLTDAFARIPILPESDREARGGLTGRLRPLEEFEPFARSVSGLDFGDPDAALDALMQAAAELYERYATGNLIVFVHTATIPGALRRLWSHVDRSARKSLVAHAWQAVAAFYSGYAIDCEPVVRGERALPSLEEMTQQAIDGGEAHAFKLLDLAWSEAQGRAASRYAIIAADVVERYS